MAPPKKDPATKHLKLLVHVLPSMRAELDDAHESTGESISAIARRAMERGLPEVIDELRRAAGAKRAARAARFGGAKDPGGPRALSEQEIEAAVNEAVAGPGKVARTLLAVALATGLAGSVEAKTYGERGILRTHTDNPASRPNSSPRPRRRQGAQPRPRQRQPRKTIAI